MKITSIKTNFSIYKNITSPQKTYLKPSKDILDINFTSKNKDYSSRLQETIESDYMKNCIVNDVIKDKNGRYQEEVEEIFLDTYLDMLDTYEEDGEEITPTFKINLQEATLETFKALKRKDDSLNLQQNIKTLIIIALEAIENNVYGVDEIFNYCKLEDESIDEDLAEIICNQKICYPNVSNKQMLYMFSNYFFDKNTQILDIYSIPMLFSLFSLGNAQNLSETDTLYTLVIDKNDSFNEDRYEFAYTTIDCLQRIAKKETSKESQQEDAFVIKAIITSITGAIMESVCLNNKGEFNKKEAEELLEYLINNANQINVLYKEEGLKPIKLNSNSSYKKGSIFNSKLYKMFNILCA